MPGMSKLRPQVGQWAQPTQVMERETNPKHCLPKRGWPPWGAISQRQASCDGPLNKAAHEFGGRALPAGNIRRRVPPVASRNSYSRAHSLVERRARTMSWPTA